jgi:hypothetical protein
MSDDQNAKKVKMCIAYRNEKRQVIQIQFNVLSEDLSEDELLKISNDLYQFIMDNAFKLGQLNNA